MKLPNFASRTAKNQEQCISSLNWVIGALAILLLTGCVSYSHKHMNLDGTSDTTKFSAFIYVGNASKIRSATKMGTNYSRTVSLGSIEGKGDADFIAALAAGIIQGMKASQGVP